MVFSLVLEGSTTMADASLFAVLQSYYPNVPSMVVIKVMRKFDNDKEKCVKALDEEKKLYPDPGILGASPVPETFSSSSNNLRSPSEGKSITTRVKEIQLSLDGGSHSKPITERHVSTIERSLINARNDPKRTIVSSTSQPGEKPANPVTGAQASRSFGNNTPQTAPADFTPFIYNRSPIDVPNIDCRAGKSRQVPITTSSPVEQRRPVKVINIPPGSSSGGSVSPAAAQPNHRQIRMHFGDTGGVCTVSTPPSNMQRFGSSPNVSQHFRTEIRTETSSAQPVHSSSILVNTTNHGNHLTLERKNNGIAESQADGGRRTPVPPLNINSCDFQASPGSNNLFQASRPLSTPVQATSPGTAHSRPVFVEIKHEPFTSVSHGSNYNDNFQSGIFQTVRAPPSYSSPGYNLYNQYNSDFPNLPHHEQLSKLPGYNSPPTNVYQAGYPDYSSYRPYEPGYSGTPGSHHLGQPPNHLSQYTHYTPQSGSNVGYPKSPSVGAPQPLVASRSSSQESEHSDYENRNHPYNNTSSTASSHSSINSDLISGRDKGVRSRSGSIQEEADYIQALLQHQKSRKKKLEEDTERYLQILEKLRSEVGEMEKNMIENNSVNKSFPSVEDISKLCESNRRLQTDIQMFMNEIDMYKSGQIPVSKISPLDQQNFFANMPTGQQDPIYNKSNLPIKFGERRPAPLPPSRPPPPIPSRQQSAEINQASEFLRVPPVPPTPQPSVNSGDSEEGESWNCTYCTFSNHPAMKKCEVCEMPRKAPESVNCPPIPPHQPLVPLPPRLAPSQPLGHHHRAGELCYCHGNFMGK
ncbi:hypothetical protein Btru_061828 [Bulinus truncatus]|nr:hypothetical protein Btru_061828 [Bulinus truncatus]